MVKQATPHTAPSAPLGILMILMGAQRVLRVGMESSVRLQAQLGALLVPKGQFIMFSRNLEARPTASVALQRTLPTPPAASLVRVVLGQRTVSRACRFVLIVLVGFTTD